MEVFEADELTAKLFDYFERRNYISSEPLGFREDEGEISRIVEMATILPQMGASESVIVDIAAAEAQFVRFATWASTLTPENSGSELKNCLLPMLCHMYLDCLPSHSKPTCVQFFEKLSSNLISESWYPFVEQLFSVESSADLNDAPLVKSYRGVLLELKLLPDSVVSLRKFLAANDLHIVIQILQQWFHVTVLTDDLLKCEEEAKDTDHDQPQERKCCQEKEVKESSVNDPAMISLLHEINNKRTQSTPPPPVLLYTAHRSKGIVCGKVSEDGKFAATGDVRSEVRVWNLGETKLTPQLHENYFGSIPVNTYTEAIDDSQYLKEKQMWWLRGHSDTVQDVAFVNNSDFLLSVSFDCTMRLWRLADFSCSVVYRGHSSPVWSLAISPIANMVATASRDKTARIWNLDRTFPVRIMAGHLQDVTCVAFHPNGSYLASGSPDRSVRLWSVTNGSMVRVFGGSGQGPVDALAFSPNGQFAASAGDDSYVWLWDLNSGTVMCKLSGHSTRIVSLGWNHDGSAIAAGALDGTIYLWNLDTPEACEEIIGPKKYSTDCQTLLSLRYSTKNALVAVGTA